MPLAETDRRVASLGEPVWQLALKQRIPNSLCHPVLSKDGELLAITLTDTGELLLAVPVDKLREILPESLGKLPVKSAIPTQPIPEGLKQFFSLGIEVNSTPVPASEFRNQNYRGGLRIEKIIPGTPAEKSGVQAGDILVGRDKYEITSLQNLEFVLSQPNDGKLKFYAFRKNETLYGHFDLKGTSPPQPAGPLQDSEVKLQATPKPPLPTNVQVSFHPQHGEHFSVGETVDVEACYPNRLGEFVTVKLLTQLTVSATHVDSAANRTTGIELTANDVQAQILQGMVKQAPEYLKLVKHAPNGDAFVHSNGVNNNACVAFLVDAGPNAALLAKLQGAWEITWSESDSPGEKPPADLRVEGVIEKNLLRIWVTSNGKRIEAPAYLLQLGQSGPPQQIDMIFDPNGGDQRMEVHGIIEIKDDFVQICVDNSSDSQRPEVFAVGKRAEIWELRRPAKQSPLHLGVQLAPTPVVPEELKDTPFRGGLRIEKVYARTPAAEGGLLAGDILVGLHVWEMTKLEDVQYALGQSLKGEVSFHILRDGHVRKGYVLLDGSKRPASDAGLSPEQLLKFPAEYDRGRPTLASQLDPKAALLAKLQGTWDIIEARSQGEGSNEPLPPGVRGEVTIEGNLLKMWEIVPPQPGFTTKTTRSEAGAMLLTLGAAGPPQQVDLVIGPNDGDNRRETLGIIEISGDTVRLCYDPQDVKNEIKRPEVFAIGVDADLWVYKRRKETAQTTQAKPNRYGLDMTQVVPVHNHKGFESGLLVDQVQPGGPADRQGILRGRYSWALEPGHR